MKLETKYETKNPSYAGDKPSEKPIIERKREWTHPDTNCPRKNTPIYTAPDALPGPCGRNNPWAGGCGKDEWNSGGVVLRDKGSKQVVHREKSHVVP